jgi:TatD DNase family protein
MMERLRKAEKEIIEILKDYPSLKRVLHCFCGNMKLVKSASEIGCYFSIPASIVRMENFQRLIEIVPKERILTETDAPYLSPFRGEKNKPENISETIKMLAKIWNLKEFEVEKIIEQNVRDIFIEIFK